VVDGQFQERRTVPGAAWSDQNGTNKFSATARFKMLDLTRNPCSPAEAVGADSGRCLSNNQKIHQVQASGS
jgi:hypothetical protein